MSMMTNARRSAFHRTLSVARLEDARAQFETNFFGVVRMVKAVLPLMRQQKRGRIINVGSLAGLSPIPFLGIYSASKFALEGDTEALRHEVKPFNIHVSLTEVGFLKTPMMNNRQVAAIARLRRSLPAGMYEQGVRRTSRWTRLNETPFCRFIRLLIRRVSRKRFGTD